MGVEDLLSLVMEMKDKDLGDVPVAQVPTTWQEDLNSDHQYPLRKLSKAIHASNP